MVGLHCCVRASSGYSRWGPLFIATSLLWSTGSRCLNLVALRHVGSSQTRDWTRVPSFPLFHQGSPLYIFKKVSLVSGAGKILNILSNTWIFKKKKKKWICQLKKMIMPTVSPFYLKSHCMRSTFLLIGIMFDLFIQGYTLAIDLYSLSWRDVQNILLIKKWKWVKVMSNSLQTHGVYSRWNSPGQNTGVGSCSLLQGIFQTQGSNPGLLHCGWIIF